MNRSSIDIVIVDYNAGPLLRSCLKSIEANAPQKTCLKRVVVVDNASEVPSSESAKGLSLPITVLRNESNRGFAAACNQGAAGSQADYLLFLNPDTALEANSLDAPALHLERNPQAGIASIRLVGADGEVIPQCRRFPRTGFYFLQAVGLDRLPGSPFRGTVMREWDHRDDREVDQVSGAFLMIRRTLFEALGGFDERFFVYFEEVDLCLRAKQSGWRVAYLAGAEAYHREHGTSDRVKPNRIFYSLRSRILYGFKHFGPASAVLLLFQTLFIEPLSRIALSLGRGSLEDAGATLKGYFKLGGWLLGLPGRTQRQR